MTHIVMLSHTSRKDSPLRVALEHYRARIDRYDPAHTVVLADEASFTAWLDRQGSRASLWLVLLDPRGKQLTSEAFAERLRNARDTARRRTVLAIGPADGWSSAALALADLALSLGAMTLPHELAAVAAAEQLYRAHTILAGHPYHLGH